MATFSSAGRTDPPGFLRADSMGQRFVSGESFNTSISLHPRDKLFSFGHQITNYVLPVREQ